MLSRGRQSQKAPAALETESVQPFPWGTLSRCPRQLAKSVHRLRGLCQRHTFKFGYKERRERSMLLAQAKIGFFRSLDPHLTPSVPKPPSAGSGTAISRAGNEHPPEPTLLPPPPAPGVGVSGGKAGPLRATLDIRVPVSCPGRGKTRFWCVESFLRAGRRGEERALGAAKRNGEEGKGGRGRRVCQRPSRPCCPWVLKFDPSPPSRTQSGPCVLPVILASKQESETPVGPETHE